MSAKRQSSISKTVQDAVTKLMPRARTRSQTAAAAAAKTPSGDDEQDYTYVAVGCVVLLITLVIIGVLWSNSSSSGCGCADSADSTSSCGCGCMNGSRAVKPPKAAPVKLEPEEKKHEKAGAPRSTYREMSRATPVRNSAVDRAQTYDF